MNNFDGGQKGGSKNILRELELKKPVRIDPHAAEIMKKWKNIVPQEKAKETAKTPEWILKRYPNVSKELPKHIVDDFNAQLEKAERLMEKYGKGGLFDTKGITDRINCHRVQHSIKKARVENRNAFELLEESFIFADYMNNFSYCIFGRMHIYTKEDMKQKFGNMRDSGGYEASDLLKNQTREEFHDVVKKVIKECGLSYEEAKELYEKKDISVHQYLFPAFLKLMEMGYKRYPDLIA